MLLLWRRGSCRPTLTKHSWQNAGHFGGSARDRGEVTGVDALLRTAEIAADRVDAPGRASKRGGDDGSDGGGTAAAATGTRGCSGDGGGDESESVSSLSGSAAIGSPQSHMPATMIAPTTTTGHMPTSSDNLYVARSSRKCPCQVPRGSAAGAERHTDTITTAALAMTSAGTFERALNVPTGTGSE